METIMPTNGLEFIAWGLVVGSAIGCLYTAYSCWAVRHFLALGLRVVGRARPVTVLKPLCGEDHDLYENLRSLCRQDHPQFQIVFGVRDAADGAIAIVHRLMAEFPAADLTLVVDDRCHGRNFKVANLRNMLPAARHDILVIADSDMRVGPGYLTEVTGPLADPAIGLVTCLYRGVPGGGPWSSLACLHVNHSFLPGAAVGEAWGAGAGCFGATMALRRDTLERIGGFAAVADDLADDFALGAAVRRDGGRIELSRHLVDNIIVEPTLAALFQHELRWARTIRLVAPAGFLGSIVTQPVALAGLACCLGALPLAAPGMLVLALLCRVAAVREVDRSLGLPPSPLHLLPLRDLLSFGVFVASFFARRVAWRDSTFRVGRKGQLSFDGDSPA
jgi:ceramide glucosyltransferase